jgi:hypothetical protein
MSAIVKISITRDDAAKLLRKWRERREWSANKVSIGPYLRRHENIWPRATFYAYHDGYGTTFEIVTDRTKRNGIVSDTCELEIVTSPYRGGVK